MKAKNFKKTKWDKKLPVRRNSNVRGEKRETFGYSCIEDISPTASVCNRRVYICTFKYGEQSWLPAE